MAADLEEYFALHQPRLVKGDETAAVGVVTDIVDRPQFDERHTAPGLFVYHLDGEAGRRWRRRWRRAAGQELHDGQQPERKTLRFSTKAEFVSSHWRQVRCRESNWAQAS